MNVERCSSWGESTASVWGGGGLFSGRREKDQMENGMVELFLQVLLYDKLQA